MLLGEINLIPKLQIWFVWLSCFYCSSSVILKKIQFLWLGSKFITFFPFLSVDYVDKYAISAIAWQEYYSLNNFLLDLLLLNEGNIFIKIPFQSAKSGK